MRRAALATCLAGVAAAAIPMWNFARQMLAFELNIGKLGVIAAILAGYAFTAIVPLFCFALYRDHGELPVSRNMGWIALIAAAVIGIVGLAAGSEWIGSFERGGVLDAAARQWTIGDSSTLLSLIADLASLLLLAALFRLSGDGSSDRGMARSKLLRLSTKIAVLAGGVVAVVCVIGLAATPWVYFQIRNQSFAAGASNARSTFSRLAVDRFRTAFTVLSVYVAPLVLWQGARKRLINRKTM